MADLDGDDMCRCGAICACGAEEWLEPCDGGCAVWFGGTCDCGPDDPDPDYAQEAGMTGRQARDD